MKLQKLVTEMIKNRLNESFIQKIDSNISSGKTYPDAVLASSKGSAHAFVSRIETYYPIKDNKIIYGKVFSAPVSNANGLSKEYRQRLNDLLNFVGVKGITRIQSFKPIQ